MIYEEKFKQYIEFVEIREEEGKAHCPFHEGDEHPSFSANLTTGLWQCFGCGAKGNFESFKSLIGSGKTSVSFNAGDEITVQTVNKFCDTLLQDEFLLGYAKKHRLWKRDIIEDFKIGWNGYRITIPIKNEKGDYVNIRCYDMLHRFESNKKMTSWRKYSGEIVLWPIKQIKHKELYLFEGEPDTILGLSLGLPSITFTAGADSVAKNLYRFAKQLKGKKIYVVYDMDNAGRLAARKICNLLSKIAEVYDVKVAHKDFTDHIIRNGIDDFRRIISETKIFEQESSIIERLDNPPMIDLSRAGYPEHHLKHISVKSIVSGKDLIPYLIPQDICITCQVNQTVCKTCPLAIYQGRFEYSIDKLDPIILELIGSTNKGIGLIFKEHFLVPKRCMSFELEVVNAVNVEELRLIPEFTFTDFESLEEYVVRQGYFVGSGIKSNAMYSFTGTTLPHPRSQHVTHIFEKSSTVESTISNFELTDDKIEILRIFKNNKEVKSKVNEILDDITYNVTNIYQRKDLLLSIILTYLSPIGFKFLDKPVKKGWIESLVIGDTRCGKTETIERFITHARLGEIATGENVSYAGLIGGIQTIGNRFMISWGKIPLNDKRLLVIDEASSLEVETIEKLSGVRSGGIAEITKIQSERTFARTRLIWLSNPRSNRPVKSYDLGILTVRELIGKPEDIARFDYVLILSAEEVDKMIINRLKHKKVKHIYTSEAFNNLVLWAWSRTKEQIKFEKDVESYILERALNISEKFHSDIPLVDPADFRLKLARLSISTAILMFSTDDSNENVIIKKEHVDYACSFLDMIYTKTTCGFDIYTDRRLKESTVKDSKEVIDKLVVCGREFVECLSDAQFLRVSDFEDFGDLERPEAKNMVSFLVRRRAIMRKHSFYVKTPPFINLLKKILADESIVYGEEKNEEV